MGSQRRILQRALNRKNRIAMIITYLRSSFFGSYEFCENKFFIANSLGIVEPSNLKADMGTVGHKVMEILALCKKGLQENKRKISDEEGIVDNIRIRDYIGTDDNIPQLTDIVYDYYSSRLTHNNWTNKARKDCHSYVSKIIGTMFDPRNRTIIDAEPHFDFTIEKPWAKYKYYIGEEVLEGFLQIKGTIDLVTNAGDDIYEITDYKFGRRLNWATGAEKTHEKLQDDPQLRLYHYAANLLYPEAKQIMVTIYFVNDGGPFTMVYDHDDLPQTEEMLRKKFEEIRDNNKPKLIDQAKRYLECDNNYRLDKCRKFCNFGKNTFEGTHVMPLTNKINNRLTKKGEYMSMCEQINYFIQHRDIESVVKNTKKPGHDVNKYHAPGSTDR